MKSTRKTIRTPMTYSTQFVVLLSHPKINPIHRFQGTPTSIALGVDATITTLALATRRPMLMGISYRRFDPERVVAKAIEVKAKEVRATLATMLRMKVRRNFLTFSPISRLTRPIYRSMKSRRLSRMRHASKSPLAKPRQPATTLLQSLATTLLQTSVMTPNRPMMPYHSGNVSRRNKLFSPLKSSPYTTSQSTWPRLDVVNS